MKKAFIFLIGIVSFLGVNTVSADEIYLEYDEDYSITKSHIETIGIDNLNKVINKLMDYYESNYSENYPYYYFSISPGTERITVYMYYLNNLDFEFSDIFSQRVNTLYNAPVTPSISEYDGMYCAYDISTNTITDITLDYSTIPVIFIIHPEGYYYAPYAFYYSNFDYYYYGSLFSQDTDDLSHLDPDDTLYIPNNADPTLYSVHNANSDFLIEPYYIYDGNDSLKSTYVEIDLNQYPYVALSLKDYTERDTFYTNVYVKGNYCLTSVYNYGMTEKKDIITGYKTQRCSTYYDNYTLVRTYILSQDIENNAIYYLKAYDTSKDNLVKVDTSIFDITYINEDTKENPYVNISGKTYPTIAYNSLTDSATLSEDEDYVSGVTCQVGDFNCYTQNNPENIFDEVFTSPLNFLKSIWSSITSIFDIIGEFISLLPETMQSFLYLSFMIAIILGLLKLIL